MLDIRLFRSQPERVAAALARMGVEDGALQVVLALDDEVRAFKTQVESARAELNAASKRMAQAGPDEREARRVELRNLGDRIAEIDKDLATAEAALRDQMLLLPNMPDERVPDGTSDADNLVVRTWGAPRPFTFDPRPHWEIGERLGILDIERGIKVSGSRFYVLMGAGAALQRALITYMLDLHIQQGYLEVYPPFVVKRECLIGTGQLPKFADHQYHDVEDDVWLVPTAEVPVTNLHRDEILEAGDLPRHYVAYTPCFRRERMSAGRDVRGIKRGHQFDKVEMVKLCAPANSDSELEALVGDAEAVCKELELPFRTVLVCTGEKGDFNAIQYDVEVWSPASAGEEGAEWLEVSSCSNFRDFQARRANIRYRSCAGARPEFVHTLNGSGLALPRVVIALLENYQQEDGSVVVPAVLRPYLHGLDRITPA